MFKTLLKQTFSLAIVALFFACGREEKNTGSTADSLQLNKDLVKDQGWPRQVIKNAVKLVYYQPQLETWKDYDELDAEVAFSITKNGREELGILSLETGTLVDKDTRQVFFRNLQFRDIRFPSVPQDSVQQWKDLALKMIPKNIGPISVDRLLAALHPTNKDIPSSPLKNDPPIIYFSSKPAILLMIQGSPIFAPIKNTNLQYIVNTNWDVFFDQKEKKYYLLVEDNWFTTADLTHPWLKTYIISDDLKKLPSHQNFDEVKKEIPPPKVSAKVPIIFYSTVPAELILMNGAPQYQAIPETGLSYIKNTENDVFKDDQTNLWYLLLSGRWFVAHDLNGPWGFAGDHLPAGFARIPEDSEMGRVLSAVPGTQTASDAVMLAQVPTTAIVNKAEVEKRVKVKYDNQPQFKPIEQTNLEYAVNTPDKVIKDQDEYYLCQQGIWFSSNSANGPWKTATLVPKEIYTIPPSSPVYNVTYVTQTETSPTTVESKTTAGYLGMFVLGMATGAVLTYGTGYYHPPYIYIGPEVPYPIYRPWPATYGSAAVYNPWTGGYAVGRRDYGPYGAVGSSAWYNPSTGRYGRSASVQGWYGGQTVAKAYNPWTGAYSATHQGHNPYSQWGHSVASKGGDWVKSGHIDTRRGGVFGYQTSGGKAGVITRGSHRVQIQNAHQLFAGQDKNVYRKNSNGSFSREEKGKWKTQHPVTHLKNEKGKIPKIDKGVLPNKPAIVKKRTSNSPVASSSIIPKPLEFKAKTGINRNEVPTIQKPADHSSITSRSNLQHLNRVDAARQRGELQTQKFQRPQIRTNNFSRRFGHR